MPKYRECSVDEFLTHRKMTTRDGIAYRAAHMPKSFNAEDRSAVFVMTDESVDSYGDIVKSGGADLYRFEKNPIALLNHRSDMPLGTWSDVQKKPQRLEGKITVAKEGTAPHVDMAYNLMSQGILRAASIGFMPTKLEVRLDDDGDPMWCYIIHEWELYECSVVSVPANPGALARSIGDGDDLRIARDYIEQVLDNFVKTPEGLLIPRSEYAKAYRVVVEKIADDTVWPPAEITIETAGAGDASIIDASVVSGYVMVTGDIKTTNNIVEAAAVIDEPEVLENKTGTADEPAQPVVVTIKADTTEVEAAVERVEGLFTRLAKKFPAFFPKEIEERLEPTFANPDPLTPPEPPPEEKIAATLAKAAAVRARLVEKNLIAA